MSGAAGPGEGDGEAVGLREGEDDAAVSEGEEAGEDEDPRACFLLPEAPGLYLEAMVP